MASAGFWDDARRAQGLVRERNDLSRLAGRAGELSRELADLHALWEMAIEEADESLEPEIQSSIQRLRKELQDFELTVVLSGDHDRKNAILSIHAGAGGANLECLRVRKVGLPPPLHSKSGGKPPFLTLRFCKRHFTAHCIHRTSISYPCVRPNTYFSHFRLNRSMSTLPNTRRSVR